METALAILLALTIYIGIPALIGFAIIGVVVLAERRRKARVLDAEAMLEEVKPTETEPAREQGEPVGASQKQG